MDELVYVEEDSSRFFEDREVGGHTILVISNGFAE